MKILKMFIILLIFSNISFAQALKMNKTISSGDSTSEAFYLQNKSPVAIILPAEFTGTLVSFETLDAGEWIPINNPNTGLKYEIYYAFGETPLIPQYFNSMNNIRVVSNAAESADRTVKIKYSLIVPER